MAQKYFQSLNYTLGNEDTRFEVELLKRLPRIRFFSIAGCGSRALPLLATNPTHLTLVDVSRPQLLLSRLRLETIKQLAYDDFLMLWGFPPYAAYNYKHKRRALFYELELEKELRDFFFKIFNEISWGSLLYLGGWERTFKTLSHVVKLALGDHRHKIMEFNNINEQREYFENKFPISLWKTIIFGLGNRSVFNALLYKGDFIKKNVPESHYDYYYDAFDRLLTTQIARESFFMHLCFFGEIIHPDGNTIEAEKENFASCKSALQDRVQINFIQSDFQTSMSQFGENEFDFVSLSDVPSYFSGPLEKDFLQILKPKLQDDAVVVLRYYLREAETDYSGFVDISPQFSDLIARERVQMYRIKVLLKQN